MCVLAGIACAGPKAKHVSAGGTWDTIPHVVDGASWKTTITSLSSGLEYDGILQFDNTRSRKRLTFLVRNPKLNRARNSTGFSMAADVTKRWQAP